MRAIDLRTGKSCFRKLRRRYDDVRCPHELTFTCYHGFAFLAKDRSRQWFVDALEKVRHKHENGFMGLGYYAGAYPFARCATERRNEGRDVCGPR